MRWGRAAMGSIIVVLPASGAIYDPYVLAWQRLSCCGSCHPLRLWLWGGVGGWEVGSGGCNNVPCACNLVSCCAMRSSLALAILFRATLWDLFHLQSCVMVHYEILSCTCNPGWCYAMRSSLALAILFQAALWDLLLHLQSCFMLCYDLLLDVPCCSFELRTRDPKDRGVAKQWWDTVNCSECELRSQLGKLAKENVWNSFFSRGPSKNMEKHNQNRNRGVPFRATMRISNRSLDVRDKNCKYYALPSEPQKRRCIFPGVANHAVA